MSSLDLKEPFVSEAGLIDIVAVDNVVDRLLIMWIKLFNILFYQVAHQVFDEMCECKIFDNLVICSCNFSY